MLVLGRLWFLLLSSRNHMSGGSLVRADADIISAERGWRIKCFLTINRVSGHPIHVQIFGPSPWSGNGMRWFSQRPLCHFPCLSSHRRWELSPQLSERAHGEQALEWLQILAEGCWFPVKPACIPCRASSQSFPVHSFHRICQVMEEAPPLEIVKTSMWIDLLKSALRHTGEQGKSLGAKKGQDIGLSTGNRASVFAVEWSPDVLMQAKWGWKS